MCGVTGFINKKKNPNFENLIDSMVNALKHRGPNFSDKWIKKEDGIALGHTRLSIRDLSLKGNQPMSSKNNRFVIVYNGEIYNHEQIKTKFLEGIKLNSSSDTEIILESVSKIGFENTIKNLDGMFALAVYDKNLKKLFLARDRVGVKPLYWCLNESFFFGSEIKALKKYIDFKNIIERKSFNFFLRFGYINQPLSIYKDIYQVMPGEILEIDSNLNISKKKFFEHYENFAKDSSLDNFENCLRNLENTINLSVKKSLASDVEVGCFLSGGTDSSIISYYMSKNSLKKIKTFCLFSKEIMTDESLEAKNFSEFIGSDHYEIELKKENIEEYFQNMHDIYDEPFADTSRIPTNFISKFAKQHVSVVLSGDGGDELFGGYSRYVNIKNKLMKKSDFKTYRNLQIAKILNVLPMNIQNQLGIFIKKPNLSYRINKLIKNFENSDEKDLYLDSISNNYDINDVLFNSKAININEIVNYKKISKDPQENFLMYDFNNFLPSRLLTKVDRESMKYSLEVRVPFLNNDVIDLASKIPINYKININSKKFILKKLLEKNVNKNLIKEEKMGFGLRENDLMLKMLRKESDHIFSDQKNITNSGLNFSWINENWNNLKKTNDKKIGKILWNLFVFLKWSKDNI